MIKIYTDGGYSIPKNWGGYAFVVIEDDNVIYKESFTEQNSTSARMEIKAFIAALEYSHKHFPDTEVNIYTDNKYVVQGYSSWSDKWKAKGWKKPSGGEIKNLELWKTIDGLKSPHIISNWVKGHNGDEYNELVDSMTRDYLKPAPVKDDPKTGLGDTKIHFVAAYKVRGVHNYASIQDCVDYIKTLDIAGLDIETTRKFKEGKYNEKVYKGGLDPFLSNIIMIQIGDLQHSYVIDIRDFTIEELQPLIEVLHWNDKTLFVGHNLKFEGRFLLHNYQIQLKKVHDTMITELVLTNGVLGTRYGLADLAKKYLGIGGKEEFKLFEMNVDRKRVTLNDRMLEKHSHMFTPFEIESSFFIDKSTRLQFVKIGKKKFNKKQVLYGSDDIVLPLLIKERQDKGRQITKAEIYSPERLIKTENVFTQVLANVENNGMSIVPEKWLAVADKNEAEYEKRVAILNKYVTHHYPETSQGNLFNPEADCAIEWSSSKQVIFLFRRIGFCPKEFSKQTKRVEFTVGAVSLTKLLPNDLKELYFKNKWKGFEEDENGNFVEDEDQLILAYLLVKKTEQSITTFGRDWLKYIHPVTGRVHPNFRQILNTGRLSSVNPNLMNISGGDFRKCFAVTKDESMINTDYAAQEIRILADNSNDPLFVAFFTQGDEFYGEDFHSYTATKVFGIMRDDPTFIVPPKEIPNTNPPEDNPDFTDEHKTMRDHAKKVNFGIAYGKSAKGFSEDFGMSMEDAEKLIQSYLDVYEGLADYFLSQRKKAAESPYIQIDKFLDRRWFYPSFKEMRDIWDSIWDFFPEGLEGYMRLSRARKDLQKAEVYAENPIIPSMWKDFFRFQGAYERKFLNYPIQGTASSILKIAMCGLRNEIVENGYTDFKLTNFIHDEVLAEVPKEKGDLYGALLSKWMVKGGTYLCKSVPMVADYKLKDYWGH